MLSQVKVALHQLNIARMTPFRSFALSSRRLDAAPPSGTTDSGLARSGEKSSSPPEAELSLHQSEAPSAKQPMLPPPWKDPWLYANGLHRHILEPPKYTEYTESTEEFKWVERLLPQALIPQPPVHEKYPTPSGWRPPMYPPPDLPYYVRRTRYHLLPLFLERRRDQLQLDTLNFSYVELVVLTQVEGDVFCEKDLRAYLESKLGKKVATHVNEPQGKIRVKGADRTLLEQWLFEIGF